MDADADADVDVDVNRDIECDAEKPLPPNWLPLLLWIVGTLLAVAGVPLRSSSKAAFWFLVLAGSASIIAGTVLFVMYAKRTEATLQARRMLLLHAKHDDIEACFQTQTNTTNANTNGGNSSRKSIDSNSVPVTNVNVNANVNANAETDVDVDADADADVTPGSDAYTYSNVRRRRSKSAKRGSLSNENVNVNVTWMDDNKPAGSPLAAIKHFRKEEPSNVLQSEAVMMAPDHAPKPVPALLPSMRLGYEKPYACGPANFGFTAASYDAMAINPLEAAKDTAPLFYTPPSQYPTVDDIATERQRFWSRPETPETDRTRREGLLLEAAFQLGAPNDRSMVPVTTVVASTTPES